MEQKNIFVTQPTLAPLEGLLGENDECVKCTLGLEAYRRLIQLKEAYE